MANVSISLPADGTVATVSQYNTPLTVIANEINGNLDNTNIKATAGIDASKIAGGTSGMYGAWQDISTTATIVGWSSTTQKQIFYKQVGKTIYLSYNITGTSNSTSTTIGLPVTPSTHLTYWETSLSLAINNGSISTTGPRQSIDNSGGTATTVTLTPDANGSGWTASGAKTVRGQIVYEAS